MVTIREKEHQHNPPAAEGCEHHWIIESAEGSVSKGVCKLCSAQKEFNNYFPDCLAESSKEYRKLLTSHGNDDEIEKGKEDTLSRVSRLYYATIRPSGKGFAQSKQHLFSKA
ncbi:MAG: hypothetical protein ISS53_02715 [Dehalococcoidia bacterium]|nr:hypothetical protein [Dehalococcoidia bacterium]